MILDSGEKVKDRVLRISESLSHNKYSHLRIEDDPENGQARGALRARHTVLLVIGATSLLTVGYLLNVVGAVNTILLSAYSREIQELNLNSWFMSTSFLGTAVGHIAFGCISDVYGRNCALQTSTLLVTIFALLSALSLTEMLKLKTSLILLSVMRFFLGIGIGGIMPAATVSTFEACKFMFGRMHSEDNYSSFYVLTTTLNVDIGTVASSLVPWLLLDYFKLTDPRKLSTYSLGFGALPPIVVFLVVYIKYPGLLIPRYSRRRGYASIADPPALPVAGRGSTKRPQALDRCTLKRLFFVSVTWFLYDLMIYPLNYYSSIILSGEPMSKINPASLGKLLGLSLAASLSYIPGPIASSYLMRRLHPMTVLKLGVSLQVVFSAALVLHSLLTKKYHTIVASVLLCLLLFSSEFGLGSCIGMCANKSYPREVRGRLCALSSLVAKVGAFLGTVCFPSMSAYFSSGEWNFAPVLYLVVLFITIAMALSLRRLDLVESRDPTRVKSQTRDSLSGSGSM